MVDQIEKTTNSNIDLKSLITKVDNRVKTKDVTYTKGHSFQDYQLKLELLKGIYEKGYENPSPVQEEVIPIALAGKDIIARAKNGTGKTGSYVIPMLEKLDTSKNYVQSIILIPTRELALQVSSTIRELGKYINVQCIICTGGTNIKEDIYRLHNPVQVLVGTPGRILDLASKNALDLSKCNTIALDEADKLLSQDFQSIIEGILEFLPVKRQIMLFSATFPLNVKSFKDKHMKNAIMKNLMEELTLLGITQYYTYLKEKLKLHCLHTLFQKLEINQAIVFCNTTKRVELLAKKITEMGFSCYFTHAKMDQQDRNRVYHDFKHNACRCLVSSDLFTRGIDIPNVNVVINFDFPKKAETYLHRIGRSGRFGHLGLAISMITDDDIQHFYAIQKDLDTEIEAMPQEIDRGLYAV